MSTTTQILPFLFGSLECAILRVVWANSTSLTVKDIHASLGGSNAMAYTTVMTTCVRLHEKGILDRAQLLAHTGAAFHYRARVSKATLIANSLADIRTRLNVDAHEWVSALATLDTAAPR